MHRFMGKSGLTRFMTDFVDRICVKVDERNSNTIIGKTLIIREDIVVYSIIDDNGDDYAIFIKMLYAPSYKY